MTTFMDITPSPAVYRGMLQAIIDHTTLEADRVWAISELARIKDVDAWSKQVTPCGCSDGPFGYMYCEEHQDDAPPADEDY